MSRDGTLAMAPPMTPIRDRSVIR